MAGRPTTPLTEPDLWASHPALWNEFFMVKQRKLTRDQLQSRCDWPDESSTQVAARASAPWWWSLSRSWPSLYAAGTVVLGIRPVFGCPCPLPGCRRTQRSVGAAPLFSFHLPLGSAGFHRFHRYYEEIRLLLGHGVVVVASFNTSTFVDPKRSPWVRMNGFPPLPSSIPSCHDWISGVALTSTFAQTRRPYKASLSLGAAVSLRLPSHTPSRERSVQALAGSGLMQLPTIYGCLQLAPYGTCSRHHPCQAHPVALRAPSDPADVILSINVLIYDPPPPSTLISRSGLSQGCWHRGRAGAPGFVVSSFQTSDRG